MPLTRFKLSAIEDGGIATADLADGAVTTAKLADSAVTLTKTDSLFINTEISGTEAARMPNGTTAQRANAQSGDIRFNSTTSLMEYYTGTEWKSIDAPPTVTSVTPASFDTQGDTITVSGSNFQSGITAKLVGNDGTVYNAATVTRNSSSEVTFDITAAMVTDNDPFQVAVTNTSGLSGTYDSIYYATNPVWTTSAGSLGTYYNYNRTGLSYQVTATSADADDTITYAITSGALPSGLSLNTSTGAITGDGASVGSSTTYTFEITATATGEGSTTNTTARTFTLTNGGYVVTSYTSTGSGTFTVPSGVTAVDVLVVAGGGGGGRAGGGGAGGLIYRPAYPVTPGGSVSYTLGDGGPGESADNDTGKANGQNSVFGNLTAQGGGFGGHSYPSPQTSSGNPGGSGGGGGFNDGAFNPGGSATQPSAPGDSGTYGFGNNGGPGGTSPFNAGGGGGGAGGAGTNNPAGTGDRAAGGVGKQYDISGSQTYYAGGGGGSSHIPGPSGSSNGGLGGGGQGAPGGSGNAHPQTGLAAAAVNTGGGGSAAHYNPTSQQPSWMKGGSGIIIVRY